MHMPNRLLNYSNVEQKLKVGHHFIFWNFFNFFLFGEEILSTSNAVSEIVQLSRGGGGEGCCTEHVYFMPDKLTQH